MDNHDVYQSLHERHQVVHEAIKSVAHDAACRCHVVKRDERLEALLWEISRDATEAARRLKEREAKAIQ